MDTRALAALAATIAAALGAPARAETPGGAASPLADDPTIVALAVALACAPAPDASEGVPRAPAPAEPGPTLELVASVNAKSLVFDVVPRVNISFSGVTPRHTVWKTERVNLPAHPEPGVVYRDVKVRLTVTSNVDELTSLLREAKRLSRGVRVQGDDEDAPVAPAAASGAPALTPTAAAAQPASPVVAAPGGRPPAVVAVPPAVPPVPAVPAVPSASAAPAGR